MTADNPDDNPEARPPVVMEYAAPRPPARPVVMWFGVLGFAGMATGFFAWAKAAMFYYGRQAMGGEHMETVLLIGVTVVLVVSFVAWRHRRVKGDSLFTTIARVVSAVAIVVAIAFAGIASWMIADYLRYRDWVW